MGRKYLTRDQVVSPDLNTAAKQYYEDPQGFTDYNTLSNLLGLQPGYDTSVQSFSPGEWNFNEQGFIDDWKNKYKADQQAAAQQAINEILGGDPYVYNFGGEPTNVYQVPTYWDTKYGRIRNDMAQAGQTIKPPAADFTYRY